MATERLPMRKILEILRLRWVLGLTVRETSAALGMSTGAVSRTTERAHAAALSYEAASALTHEALERALYPVARRASAFVEPDVRWIHRELRRVGVTLELLHQEYRAEHGERALGYSAFCRRYQRWRARRGPVLRKHYVGGEVLFVDFSGKRPSVVDRLTGKGTEVELFVAVMGASNFTYVEAVATQRVGDWIGAHTRALDYLGGVPRTVVPDQLRAGVSEPDRYEPRLQRTYEDLGRHYGTAVIPARPRKPRDKAKVEAGVLVAQRWILARLRDETFFSLEALNARIRELLGDLNARPMKSLGGVSRRELFEGVDQPALMPLPRDRFEPAEWSKARVHEDYHVDVRRHWYSAPFELIGAGGRGAAHRVDGRAVSARPSGRLARAGRHGLPVDDGSTAPTAEPPGGLRRGSRPADAVGAHGGRGDGRADAAAARPDAQLRQHIAAPLGLRAALAREQVSQGADREGVRPCARLRSRLLQERRAHLAARPRRGAGAGDHAPERAGDRTRPGPRSRLLRGHRRGGRRCCVNRRWRSSTPCVSP